MTFQLRLLVRCDTPGGFAPGSFEALLQTVVHIPGLDPTWTHTLIDAVVAEDGGSAEFTVHSAPNVALSLDASLRVVTSTPAAWVRAVDEAGTVLAESSYAAPLRETQEVEIAGQHYTVTATSYPGRNPETGACAGDIDWQVAVVAPRPRAVSQPVPVVAS
ncbi:hypothetical protein [Pseudonocardia sp. T1-2H]|uniref:hypothetical protein n=1 Tax=Pseudonocardia sp. T1-2H TaxID=3128899 RepID=UPI00310172EC